MSHRQQGNGARLKVMAFVGGAVFMACAVGPSTRSKPEPNTAIGTPQPAPSVEDCHPYLQNALVAFVGPADTTPGAPPPGYVHGVKMHEYHKCLRRAAATQASTPP